MARENSPLGRHVEKLWPDFEHLFEVGEQVVALRSQQGWSAVAAVLDAEIDAINAQMEAPHPLSRADYAVRHGRIGGLKAALQVADTIVATAERKHAEQQAKHEGDAESSPER